MALSNSASIEAAVVAVKKKITADAKCGYEK